MRRHITFALAWLLLAVPASAQITLTPKNLIFSPVDARTIASNGGGTPATLTLTPKGSYVALTCNDPDGCTITMGETGAKDGYVVSIVNVSVNPCTFANSAGVLQLSSSVSLGQWQVLDVQYVTDRWVGGTSGGGSGTVTTTGSPASGNLAFFSAASSITSGNLSGDVTTSGTGATTIANDAVSNAKLRNSGALSVIGRSANSSGDPADISAVAASDCVFRESGSTVGCGTVATAGLAASAVTYAKIQNVSAASRLLGRGSASGAGAPEEITLGSGLTMSGTQLSATGGGGGGGGTSVYPARFEGRLTLETGVPVSTTDQTAKSTLYWTPCVAYTSATCTAVTTGVVTLWNGTGAVDFATTQLSKALSGLTSGANYDVFIDYNGGSPQIVLSAAWTTDTARADALGTQYDATRQVTLPVKNGTSAYLWVGMIRTTSTTTTEDSGGITGTTQVGGKRFVWNAYNQVPRALSVIDTTDSWGYTTNTIRQAGGVAGNKVEYVAGSASALVEATVIAGVSVFNNSVAAKAGVGVDSTSTFSGLVGLAFSGAAATATILSITGTYAGYPGLGYHFLSWNEKGANNNSTFTGDDGADSSQSGLRARIWN